MSARESRICVTMLLVGAALGAGSASARPTAPGPTVRVPSASLPRFEDDLSLDGLSRALARHRSADPVNSAVTLGGTRYSSEHVRRSRERFERLVRLTRSCLRRGGGAIPGSDGERKAGTGHRAVCWRRFREEIASEFAVYALSMPARLTAYYTPTIDVSPIRDGAYRYPIYRLPESPVLRHLSREDIDFRGALADRGLELFYARSRFDIYVMQTEGGGRVRIHSGGPPRMAYLTFAGDNGRPARLIEESMMRWGMLRPDDPSREAQRRFLERETPEAARVYASDPSYEFFKVSRGSVPGSSGAVLTAGRSLAADPEFYPVSGLIAFVTAPLPVPPQRLSSPESNPAGLRHRRMSRFFVDQDAGPYIRGSARFDLFFGESRYAEFLANNLDTRGSVYFIVLKRAGDR